MNNKKRKNVPFKGEALEEQRVAHHEAAHAVLCIIFRQKFSIAEIDMKQNNNHVDLDDTTVLNLPCSCQNCEKKYSESQAFIIIAGFVAGHIFLSKNAQDEDVDWKRVEEELDEEMQNTAECSFNLYTSLKKAGFVNNPSTFIKKDFIYYSEELKGLLDFDNSSESGDIYSYHYECFFMHKCAHILLQPPVWEAVEAVAALLVGKKSVKEANVMRTCQKIQGFESVADRLRVIYIGQTNPTRSDTVEFFRKRKSLRSS